MLAWAQILFTALFFLALFAIIVIFEVGGASHLSDAQQKTFDATLAYLKDAGLLIVGFWFSRLRSGGMPESMPTITQTRIDPDGSKSTLTSPAHLPLPSLPNPTAPPSQAAK
jgi:hypothetical protein